MFNKNLFGSRLRETRQKHGEIQPAVAALLGVSASQISEMENGNKTTTIEKLTLLCAHYHVSSDYLLGLTDDPTPFNRIE